MASFIALGKLVAKDYRYNHDPKYRLLVLNEQESEFRHKLAYDIYNMESPQPCYSRCWLRNPQKEFNRHTQGLQDVLKKKAKTEEEIANRRNR